MMELGRRDFKTTGFPVGFRFRPSDEELIGFYLLNKMRGQIDDLNNIIPECDLYGDKNPWELWETYGGTKCANEEEFYCFTKLKKKSLKGLRLDRTIGLGTWEGESANSLVFDICDRGHNKRVIGHKKRFRFEKSGTEHDGGWIMMEFTLDKSLLQHMSAHDEYVICRVKKNERAEAGQRRKQQQQQAMREQQVQSKKRRCLDGREEIENINLHEHAQDVDRVQFLGNGINNNDDDDNNNNNINNQAMDLPPIHHHHNNSNDNGFLNAQMRDVEFPERTVLSVDELLDFDGDWNWSSPNFGGI